MKKHFAILLFAILALGLCIPPAFAQSAGSVKGVCKDAQGNPLVDAVVVWANMDNGQKYTLKTNKKGEYFSLGLSPGKYLVTMSGLLSLAVYRRKFQPGEPEVQLPT